MPDNTLDPSVSGSEAMRAETCPTRDHKRVTAEGRTMGAFWVRAVEPTIQMMEREGDPDDRCKSCAFRAGTVPNGCPQTMMDVTKAVLEQVPFQCHAETYADGSRKLCAGWLASQWGAADRRPTPCPWPFSPPDEPTTPSTGIPKPDAAPPEDGGGNG